MTTDYVLETALRRLRRSIPSLGALNAFEAAARLQSFTAAAAELGVTQAAVSRRIKELEIALETQLFIRANRRVQANGAGLELFEAVNESFDKIAVAIDNIRSAAAVDSVTIGVSLAFAHFRLIPALTAFHTLYPDIRVRVISEDVWTHSPDQSLDLELRYGTSQFDGQTIIASLPEVVFPVCSPDFAAHHSIDPAQEITGATLAELPLIEGEQRSGRFLSWGQWFRWMGMPTTSISPRLQFSNYSDAAYAAMNGDGVAVGWGSLLQRPISDGRLVALGTARVTPPGQHHLLVKKGRSQKKSVEAFAEWFTQALVQSGSR
ncbi:LysR family transcriptional regulator [Rhodobacteraceae bacterium S2214]|nr:LysR family transcriptional regulator [Rhodobacteraceae bacterium S2214]